MAATTILLALMLAAPSVHASDASVNPMGKALQLIDELAAKITAEGEEEAKAYADFVEWCDDTSKNTGFEIKTATSKKEKLEATIKKAKADQENAATKIDELAASIKTSDDDLKAATAIREKEAAEFATAEGELVDTVDTLGRAIGVLSKEMAKNPAAFAQMDTTKWDSTVKAVSAVIDAASFLGADKEKIVALVQSQQGSDDEELGAPAAATYKSHSTNILDVLEDMKEKAEDQLAELRKVETSNKHNFSMLKQSLEDQLAADNKDMDAEKAKQAAAAETEATAEGELAITVKDLANAEQSLATCHSDCMTTAADHEATVAARTEELKVIAEAKKILMDTSSGAVEQSYSMLQLRMKLRTRADLKNNEVVAVIKNLAEKHHSVALSQLASRIAAVVRMGGANGGDVFSKIKGLISDLIAKLESEADADAEEKAYCDEQMAKTEAKQTELEDDVEKLTTKIDQASSKSAELKEEVKELQAELAALAKEQAEMDKIRKEQNALYTKAKEELELGLSGVRKALGVLQDYYGASLLQNGQDLTAFMQQPKVPQHGKATGAGQSIIGILQVCESDFAKDLAAHEAEESDSQAEYDTQTQENAVTKTTKDQDVKYKTQEFQGLDKSIAELTADRANEESELAAVNEYYAKVKDRCVAKPESYEERAKRREAEIAGLKEALSVLENETAFVQRRKQGNLRSSYLTARQ